MASASRGETEAHRDLKRRAVLWALANGFSACATEVSLPRSRFRADVDVHAGQTFPFAINMDKAVVFDPKTEARIS